MTAQNNEMLKQRSARNRVLAWKWARSVTQQPHNVWQLEHFKTAIALVDDGNRDLPEQQLGRFSPLAALRVSFAMLIALGMWLAYVIRHRAGAGQPPLRNDSKPLFALHGEVSTRTRHLLNEVSCVHPSAIILLGRLHSRPHTICASWAKSTSHAWPSDLSAWMPMSPAACLAAMSDVPRLLGGGIACSARATVRLSWREEVAIAFRVILGTTAGHWWQRQGIANDVLFGHTGTADTVLLEHAIQKSGGKSIHIVHGQATGPNFVGFSDKALFRSKHDAQAFESLACYGQCLVQMAPAPAPTRGPNGILLLSNLAHPMNAGYHRHGLRDEMALLQSTAAAAKALGQHAQPVRWKPHPSLAQLPQTTQHSLRTAARDLGITEVLPDADIAKLAAQSRWVVSSPSTVALDLLQSGSLTLILDPQGMVLDTALRHLPQADTRDESVTAELLALDPKTANCEKMAAAHAAIGPARALDMLDELE